MKTVVAGLFVCCVAAAQTVIQTDPAVAANLKPMALQGDQTRCVATPQKTARNIHIDCKIGSVVKMTVTAVYQTSFLASGDLMWMLVYDSANPKLVHFSVCANTRLNGTVTGSVLIGAGDILWP